MAIPVTCPACGANLKASEGLIGKKVKCTKCGTVFVVSKAPSEQSNDQNKAEPLPPPTPKSNVVTAELVNPYPVFYPRAQTSQQNRPINVFTIIAALRHPWEITKILISVFLIMTVIGIVLQPFTSSSEDEEQQIENVIEEAQQTENIIEEVVQERYNNTPVVEEEAIDPEKQRELQFAKELYRAEWGYDTLFEDAKEFGLKSMFSNKWVLKFRIIINTEPGVPMREVYGRLQFVKNGKVLYSVQVAEKRSISFVDFVTLYIEIPYNDNNPGLRELRFASKDEINLMFNAQKVVLADGTVRTFK